jgi:glucose/arabinose dehydrogenase
MRTLALCVALLGCGAEPSTPLEPTAPDPSAEPAAPATRTPTTNPSPEPTVTATASVTASPAAASVAAPTTPPATATASASAAPPGPAPLEGANVNIGAFAADGLSLKDISCKSSAGGLGGLFGSMTIAAGLSKRKAALDKCGKGETRAHIWQKGGKVTKAEIVGESKVGPCVQKALVGAPATMDSECLLTIVHGQ